MTDEALLDIMIDAALAGGRSAFEIYQGHFEVQHKADDSPVTAADHAAEKVILEHVGRHAATLAVIAEEQVALGHAPRHGSDFLLVDPLDGTREFVKRNGEFTVNIALVRNGAPVLGVVYAPASAVLFAGNAASGIAWRSEQAPGAVGVTARRPIRVRTPPADGLTVVASRSHRDAATDAYLARQRVAQLVSIGSSLKFCKVAAGEADLYPRLGTTMEWDTAAGHAILNAAGGRVITGTGLPLAYGKPGYRNPWFVAAGAMDPMPPE